MSTVAPEKPVEVVSEQLQYYADNFDRLCRLCLSPDQLVSIYSNVQGLDVYYVPNFIKLALDLLAVKINIHDKLPQYVCERCERNLSVIFNFKKKCDKSLAILQHVRDSIIRRKGDGGQLGQAVEREPKKQRRKRLKPPSKQPSSEEILKKLPPGINVGKFTVRAKDKRIVKPEVTLRCSSGDGSNKVNEPKDESRADPAEQEHDDVQDDPDPEQDLQQEQLNTPHDAQDHTVSDGCEKADTVSAKIEEDFVELLEVAEEELVTEKEKHNGRRRVVCPICGALVNNVKSHLITHSDVRPHQCDQCPKSFATRNKLRSHTNSVHLRKRDFKCDVCGKAFLEKNNLKGHMRIHSGDRKYTCDVCPKSFLFAGTLRCHKLTHTQEKKHECPKCGKLFLMRTTLNKHLNVHTGERPHKCDLCDKRFRTSTHKVVHMRTHTGEKPLVCYICEMSFAHHKGRSVHMKTKHPDELLRLGMIDDRGHLKI